MPEMVTVTLRCDHCDTARNVRRYVVRDEDGVETAVILCAAHGKPLVALLAAGTSLALPPAALGRGLGEARLLSLHRPN